MFSKCSIDRKSTNNRELVNYSFSKYRGNLLDLDVAPMHETTIKVTSQVNFTVSYLYTVVISKRYPY